MTTMILGDTDSEHVVSDAECGSCWKGYPAPCAEDGCLGLVHAEWGDYSSYDSFWLYTQCDVCGEAE